MRILKSTIRRILPGTAVLAYRQYRQQRLSRRNKRLSTEQVFTDVYLKNRWGGRPGEFFSGNGSHEETVVAPYVAMMAARLRELDAASRTVVDLGCGDFSVGRRLAPLCGQYVGVDIVQPLIARNQAAFGGPRVCFRHANIVADAIPAGDICLVRQVLQHLANDQIAAVLPKLAQFRWTFVTEHLPSPGRLEAANIDKVHGDAIRISRGSGVFLDQPPFNLPAASYRPILDVAGISPVDGSDGGIIRTYLLSNP
jgi:SAM-dependent methyltransferase